MSVYPEGKAYCPHCGKEAITEKINMKQLSTCQQVDQLLRSLYKDSVNMPDGTQGYGQYEGDGERG